MSAAIETRLLIGGEQIGGEGPALAVENPYTEETIVELATASPEQVDSAIAAAREASHDWGHVLTAGERCEMLHEVAVQLGERTDELAALMTSEGGKPLVENRDEISWCVAALDYYAEIGRDSAGRVIPPIESTQVAMVLKEPMGVVGAIVPWNYPLLLAFWKIAPALAAGNSMVVKPSELTPLSSLALAPCFEHLPSGVVNLLAGTGEVGAAITADERIDCIAFTGSVETGRKVALAAADRLARTNLEMGGKDPFIVCSDVADRIGTAARGGAWAAFLNAGQVCTSAERFYVMRDVFDDYLQAFSDYTGKLVIGDPMQPDTDIGPMVSGDQRAKVTAQIDAAVEAGAAVVAGADRGGQQRGHFFAPAIVTGAAAETDLLSRETFGPVAPLVPVESLDQAIELANSTRFGLGANVYTSDLRSAVRCMRELKAGTVWINDPLTDNDAGPFGGFKQSGIGRELGREGLEAFQETKHVHMETEIADKEWWFPYSEYDGS